MSNISAARDAQEASASSPIKLTSTQRADLAFRYLDWLLTKKIPSGGFRLLYVISQCFNEENPFHCFPSLEYLAARCERSPSTIWSMLPKLGKIGAIEIVWGSRGCGHPNTFRLPAAFLEFYFGSRNGRQSAAKKPRRIGVSGKQENPDTVEKKPRCVGVNHLLATKKEAVLRTAVSIDRVPSTAARDVTEIKTTADDAALIPEIKRDSAFAGRLGLSKIDPSKTETPVSLDAAFCKPAVARDGNGAAAKARPALAPGSSSGGATMGPPDENRNGYAASRPANEPHKPKDTPMPTIPPPPPRPRKPLEASFQKLLRCYPKDRIGDDDENAFDAFDLALEYTSLTELILGAININVAASKGEEVPELVEYLVSRCGVTSLAA
ncbi:MAG: hypothetical protein WAV72_24875 [Bradyrhizobium sp.]